MFILFLFIALFQPITGTDIGFSISDLETPNELIASFTLTPIFEPTSSRHGSGSSKSVTPFVTSTPVQKEQINSTAEIIKSQQQINATPPIIYHGEVYQKITVLPDEKKYKTFSIPDLDLENMEVGPLYCLIIGKTILAGEKTKAGKPKHYCFKITSSFSSSYAKNIRRL